MVVVLPYAQLLEVVNLSLPKENNAAGTTSETSAATQGLVLANDSDTDRYDTVSKITFFCSPCCR